LLDKGTKHVFVRWQEKDRGDTVHMAAILAKAVKINGKPRQEHKAYLGGITKQDAKTNSNARCQFWLKAMKILDEKKIAGEERVNIMSALATRVPKPTKAQLQHYANRLQQISKLERKLELLQNF
jgi:hypothetical protein